MGWKSDWLYALVLAKFERAWQQAQKQGQGRFGPASADMLISQSAESDWGKVAVRCCGRVIRRWRYTGCSFEPVPTRTTMPDDNPICGMFYEHATGTFHISPDRKTVVLEYTFGPRYGRGFVYVVESQGHTGRLREKPDAPMWIA